MRNFLIAMLLCVACNAQMVPQPSITEFVHRAGNTTAEQDVYANCWATWWENLDLLVSSNRDLVTRGVVRTYQFETYGYATGTTTADDMLVSRRHRRAVDDLLKSYSETDCPRLFTESDATIRRAMLTADSLIEVETIYMAGASATDRERMIALRSRIADDLYLSRTMFWKLVVSTKTSK